MSHHVILGAGPAGIIAAETLRKHCPQDRITVVGDEREAPYSRMAIPYLLIGKVGEKGTWLRKGDTHFADLRIDIVQARATQVDAQRRQLQLDNGQTLAFDKLLIATGSHPVRPPIPGLDLPGVHTCWTLEDARAIAALAKPGAKVLQMGAGFIGCIIMEALQLRGVELSVVEMGDRMVPRMMGPMSGGQTVDADLVISATGVRPAIGFLKDSGITCLQGVLTDERMQTNVSGIYAAGDCAEAFDKVSGQTIVSAIQPNAAEQARVAALNMAGQDTTLKGVTQINVLDTLGLISTSCGNWQGVDGGEHAERTDLAAGRHLSLQFKDDLMVGCNSVGWTEHVGVMRGLVEGQVRLGEWKDKLLQDPTKLMEAYLACAQGQVEWSGAQDARRR